MDNGWIKLHRQSLQSSVWENPNTWMVWCWCLMRANHEPHKFPFNGDDIEIESGQFITGQFQAVAELNPKKHKFGITANKYRAITAYLVKTKRIALKTTNKFSLITVLNWHKFQNDHKQTTNKPQHTRNKRIKE